MWEWLFGRKNRHVEWAKRRVQAKLPAADVSVAGDAVVASEWFRDLDGNAYRLEYVLEVGGERTQAFCRSKPSFRRRFSKQGGYSCSECHLHTDGTICLGRPNVMAFERAVERCHFWANTYTFLIEHGLAETRRVVPEW